MSNAYLPQLTQQEVDVIVTELKAAEDLLDSKLKDERGETELTTVKSLLHRVSYSKVEECLLFMQLSLITFAGVFVSDIELLSQEVGWCEKLRGIRAIS